MTTLQGDRRAMNVLWGPGYTYYLAEPLLRDISVRDGGWTNVRDYAHALIQ